MGKGTRAGRKSLRRRAPSRDPRPRILVVCEGEKTEPAYLKGFFRALQVRRHLFEIQIIGADTIQWRQFSTQHMINAAEQPALFETPYLSRVLDDADE